MRLATEEPTCIYEDNAVCIKMMSKVLLRVTLPSIFRLSIFRISNNRLSSKIHVNQISFEENVADLFTKSLPKSTFEKHVKSIGMLKLSEIP